MSISPSAREPRFQQSLPTMLRWALLPAEDDALAALFERGRDDGEAWAQGQIIK